MNEGAKWKVLNALEHDRNLEAAFPGGVDLLSQLSMSPSICGKSWLHTQKPMSYFRPIFNSIWFHSLLLPGKSSHFDIMRGLETCVYQHITGAFGSFRVQWYLWWGIESCTQPGSPLQPPPESTQVSRYRRGLSWLPYRADKSSQTCSTTLSITAQNRNCGHQLGAGT